MFDNDPQRLLRSDRHLEPPELSDPPRRPRRGSSLRQDGRNDRNGGAERWEPAAWRGGLPDGDGLPGAAAALPFRRELDRTAEQRE